MTNETQAPAIQPNQIENTAKERSQRVQTVAYLAGISACVGFGTLPNSATLGTGIGFAAIAGMVAVVCYFILRDR